ncbi:MAG: hypothetical protein Fur0040_10180 [Sideroxydans sp.]
MALARTRSRLATAIAVSLLVHGWLLWGPHLTLSSFKQPDLPPLVAKLEPLPLERTALRPPPSKPARKAAAAPLLPRPLPASTPQPASAVAASSVAAPDGEMAASAVEATAMASAVAATSSVAASTQAASAPTAVVPEKTVARPPLPRRARLSYTVNKGNSNFRIGEAVHTLEIDDGRYVLQAVTQTVGLARMVKRYEITQYSAGRYTATGLVPEQFFEERTESSGSKRQTAEFDYPAQRVHFSHGGEAVLPPETQDILSILYQFPPLTGSETVPVSVVNGRTVELYEFRIVTDETIQTPLGPLHTVHLTKLHEPGQEGLEIWLAREYRLFPAKLRFLERNGEISGEVVITDIRVSPEDGERTHAAD